MENVSFRVAAGDKVGLVGRNGAGKTTLTKILAGEAMPASGSVQATGEVGYLPQDPRIGDPEVLARDRILSARGLDDVVRRLRESEAEMGSDDPAVRERAMKRYSRADAELHAGGGYAAESEAATIAQQPRHRGPDPGPAAQDPLRWPAPPGRARAHPVLRGRHAAARRAHQPPRRGLHRLAAGVPQGPQGRPDRDQPRQRAARGDRQQGAAPRREPRPRSTSTTWAGRPTCCQRETDEKRRKRERAERREQGEDAHRPGQQDAGQGHQGPGRAVDAQARREADGGRRGGAPRRQGRADQVPRAGRLRQDARSPRPSCRSPTARSRSSPTSTWPSTGARAW